MLTVRASNGQELAGLTGDVARVGVDVGRALTDFRAGFLAGAGLPSEAPQAPSAPPAQPVPTAYQPQNPTAGYGAPQAPQWSAPAPDQQQYSMPPQTGGQGQAPSCPHGQRVYKSGVSAQGKPYKMWACSAPQGPGQCKPEWVK
ncbi:hypothetical protein [Kitasatospora mediocidica]